MKRTAWTFAAFLLAPFAAASLLASMSMVFDDSVFSHNPVAWLLLLYLYTLGVTLFIALPAFLFLSYFNKVAWSSALLVGLSCGALGTLVGVTLAAIPVGGVSGLLFWALWKQGQGAAVDTRPERPPQHVSSESLHRSSLQMTHDHSLVPGATCPRTVDPRGGGPPSAQRKR